MLGELWLGLQGGARQGATFAVGSLALVVALSFFANPSDVGQDFYVAVSTTIPILLFALLLRLAALRDIALEALDETQQLNNEIAELQSEAHPDDSTSLAKLDEMADRHTRNEKKVKDLAPRLLVGVIAVLLVAAIAEIGGLAALATDESNALNFYLSSVGIAVLVYAIAINELISYRLAFGQRGVLLPAHLRAPTKQ